MNIEIVYFFTFLAGFVYGKGFADKPRLLALDTNRTVILGRDATLTCAVYSLHNYKVAWLRVDTQTVLTIGPHVITKNHRIGVTHIDVRWSLTIKVARPSDGGRYMCQINTEPMLTQTHYLHVLVPPDIKESSVSEVMVTEGDNVSLHCSASGTPEPTIMWRREDSTFFNMGEERVGKWSGEWLNMTSIQRNKSGAFLCIASNGVPPAVSKRAMVHVFCKPKAQQLFKMVGAYLGESVALMCYFEASPRPIIYWRHMEGLRERLQNGTKYELTIIFSDDYKYTSKLVIRNVSREDIGAYSCRAENSMGAAEDDVTVYTLATTTSKATTSTTTMVLTTPKATTESELPTSYTDLEDLQNGEEISGEKKKVTGYEDHVEENELLGGNNYVVVLSQHQMQSLDLPSST